MKAEAIRSVGGWRWWLGAVVAWLALSMGPAAAQEPSPLGSATGLWVQSDGQGSDLVLAIIDGRLWRLSGNGLSASNIGPDQGSIQVLTFAVTPTMVSPNFDGVIYVGTLGNGVQKTTDGGHTWTAIDHGDPCRNIASYTVVNADDHLLSTRCERAGAVYDAIHVSNDGGLTWAKRYTFPAGVQVNRLSLSLGLSSRSWAYTTRGLYFSVDNGHTWQLINDATDANSTPGLRAHLAEIPRDGNIRDFRALHSRNTPPRPELVVVQGVGLYYSPNAIGAGWQPLALLNNGLPAFTFGGRVSIIDERYYIPVLGYGLYTLDEASQTWQLAISEQALPAIRVVYRFSSDPKLWFALSGTSGIWRSTDGGANWERWGVHSVPVTPPPPTAPPGEQFTLPQGIIPPENVSVTTVGTVEKLTVTVELRIPELGQNHGSAQATTPFRRALARELGYQVFVIALVPGESLGQPVPIALQKAETGAWGAVTSPVGPFIRNVALGSQDNRVLIELVKDNDLSGLIGTEFYIGYGITDEEMLIAQRYRGVYKIR